MRILLILTLSIFLNLTGFTQKQELIDSLKNVVETAQYDTTKISAYISWGEEICMQQPDSAISLWQKSKEIAENYLATNSPNSKREKQLADRIKIDLANALNDIGFIYKRQGHIPEALEYHNKSLSIRKELAESSNETIAKRGKNGVSSSLNNIGIIYKQQGDFSKALEFYHKSLKIRKEIGNKKAVATSLNNIGFVYYNQGDIQKALEYYHKCINIQEEIGDKRGLAYSLNNIGLIYYNQGDITKSLEYFHKSLKIEEETGNNNGIAASLNNLGSVYDDQGDTPKALEYYQKTLSIYDELGHKRGMAYSLSNIGSIYKTKGDLPEALECYHKSFNIRKELDDKQGMANSLNNLGMVYNDKGVVYKALEYFHKGFVLYKELGDKDGMANSLYILGLISKRQSNVLQLKEYATRGYKISKELGFPKNIKDAASLMKELSILQGNYKKAFEYYQEEIVMRDSIQNKENYKQTQKQLAKYEYEKQAAVDSIAHAKSLEIKNLEIARIEEEQKVQAAQRNMLIVGLGLMLVLAVFIFRSYKQKKRANSLLLIQKQEIEEKNDELNHQNEEILAQNEEINAQNEEILAQRDTLVKQKEHIELIHHEVSQSIDYAMRLQSSILPEVTLIDNNLTDHFVMFKPKDKVSGDFYWWANVENNTVITAADCTGHGVPGAFMSMLGISFLREIVSKEYITFPGVILQKLRKEVIKSLKQKGEFGEQKDGMDLALISINHETNMLQYAGANNPVYIISGNGNDIRIQNEKIRPFKLDHINAQLIEIKSDKMPIAIYDKMDRFTTHEIQLQKGDMVYMFSDGYPDQFGGEKGKKIKNKPFKQLLLENANKPMNEQKVILEKYFEDWKGDLEQTDDVVVLGVKI